MVRGGKRWWLRWRSGSHGGSSLDDHCVIVMIHRCLFVVCGGRGGGHGGDREGGHSGGYGDSSLDDRRVIVHGSSFLVRRLFVVHRCKSRCS